MIAKGLLLFVVSKPDMQIQNANQIRAILKYSNLNVPLHFEIFPQQLYLQTQTLGLNTEINRKLGAVNEKVTSLKSTFPNWWYLVGIPALLFFVIFIGYIIFSLIATSILGAVSSSSLTYNEANYNAYVFIASYNRFIITALALFHILLFVVFLNIYRQRQTTANGVLSNEINTILSGFGSDSAITGIYWNLEVIPGRFTSIITKFLSTGRSEMVDFGLIQSILITKTLNANEIQMLNQQVGGFGQTVELNYGQVGNIVYPQNVQSAPPVYEYR